MGGGRVGMTADGTPLRLSCQPGRVPNVTDNDAELDESVLDEAQQAMYDARNRLADVPAEVVVSNHVMGLYELAAIHLSAEPPALHEAALAIDAVGCLVEGLGERAKKRAPRYATDLMLGSGSQTGWTLSGDDDFE